jgi:nucleotide-binding universal stress UspA family protein
MMKWEQQSMFKRVLAATDMLEACDAAVLTALEIAKQNDGKLEIIHVLESDSTIYRNFVKHYKTGEEVASDREYIRKVKKALKAKCDDALVPFNSYEITVTAGFPWEVILKLSRKNRADLIVLGPHSRKFADKGVDRTSGYIGSTIEGVIMRERCPVMIVNRVMSKERLKFKKVMMSTDFSKSCAYAFRFAQKFALKHRAKLFLFHMLPVPSSTKSSQADIDKDMHSLGQKLRELCKEIPNQLDFEFKVSVGSLPYMEIEKYADNKNVDLIVMGSHTKEKGERWYVGSAVERVSSRSNRPVIVVTDPRALLSMNS